MATLVSLIENDSTCGFVGNKSLAKEDKPIIQAPIDNVTPIDNKYLSPK
jgi:hypothetical protein